MSTKAGSVKPPTPYVSAPITAEDHIALVAALAEALEIDPDRLWRHIGDLVELVGEGE